MAKRKIWIDCAKVVAIISVILCHVKGTVYTSDIVRALGNFSVSLFVLLSGVTAWYSLSKGQTKNPFVIQIVRILKLFGAYALATLMYHIYHERTIVPKEYFEHLIDFDITGPFYFFVFFFQLMIIAPLLVWWIQFCKNKKQQILWHVLAVVGVTIIATLSIQFTSIRDYFGGSRYLFGGTYLILYYVGMLLSAVGYLENGRRRKKYCFCVVLPMWIVWWVLSGLNLLPFDKWLRDLWGNGVNPPSLNVILFAIITLLLAYSVFESLSLHQSKWIQNVLKALSVIGKATLYIFMYHMLVLDILWDREFYEESLLIRQVITIPLLIIVPILIQYVIGWSVKIVAKSFKGQR